MDTQAIQPELSIEDKIRNQVEYYLSRENLANDMYLSRQMNREMYVPISVIASFPKIKNLTTDIELIVKSISKSSSVILDETQKLVKPSFKLQRNIVILRDIPQATPVEEIKGIFTTTADAITNVKNDIVNTWFITFDTEENASKAYDFLQKATYKDKPIKVRIKSETLLRNNYKPSKLEQQGTAHTNGAANGSSRYYTVAGSAGHVNNNKWQRTVGGYPYGGWDQSGDARPPYDPTKPNTESHRKPYRGNKDGSSSSGRPPRRENYNNTQPSTTSTSPSTSPSSSPSNNNLNSNSNSSLNSNESNNITNTNNTNNTTSTTTTQQNNFSGERFQRRTHKSHANGKPSSANAGAPSTNGSTATSTQSTTESTTTTSSRKPRESKPRQSKNANGANKSGAAATKSATEEKEKPKLTPPGPQHFPPLVKGEATDGQEMKKKEWGPASTSSPVVAAASLPAPAPTPVVAVAPSSPVASSAAATSTTATSPAQSGKSSKKSNGQSPQTPTKKSRDNKEKENKDKEGKSKSDKSKKSNNNNNNANNTTPVTTPASESPKTESSSTPNGGSKQPTYADIIQGLAKQPASAVAAPVIAAAVPVVANETPVAPTSSQ